MPNRTWLPGRLLWVVGCALAGLLAALGLFRSTDVTRAQEGVAPVDVDPRWLALLSADRLAFERPNEADSPMAGTLTLNVLVQDGTVAGFAPTGAPVTIVVRRGGAPIDSGTVAPVLMDVGWLYTWSAHNAWEFAGVGFSTGDVIEVSQGSATLNFSVSEFYADAYVASNHLKGKAAANASLVIYLQPALDPAQQYTQTTTTDGSGMFDADLGLTADMMAGDSGFIRYHLDSARSAAARFVAPRLQVQVGNNLVSGYTAPRQGVLVRVLSGGSLIAAGSTIARFDGAFELCLRYCSGPTAMFATLLPGNQVELTAGDQALTTTIPMLSASSDLDDQRVVGLSAPGSNVSVLQWSGPLDYSSSHAITFDALHVVTASVGGAYTATVPLQVADYGAAVVHDAQGHLAFARYAVPHLRVVLDRRDESGGLLSGQLDLMSRPVTLTVVGPSGLPKAEIAASTSTNGLLETGSANTWFIQSGVRISAGDTISVTDQDGLSIILPLQGISVTADVLTQRISGQGPASATLPINVFGIDPYPAWPNGYEATVLTDLAGFFGLDLVGARLKTYSYGTVSWTNPAGHTIVQAFTASPTCVPSFYDVVVGGNTFAVEDPGAAAIGCGSSVDFSLAASSGSTKFAVELPFPYGQFQLELVNQQGDAVRFEPGDVLSFRNGSSEITTTVPLFQVAADVASQQVTGKAPPGRSVSLISANAFATMSSVGPTPKWSHTVVADTNGDFALGVSIEPGDRVEASMTSQTGGSYIAVAVVPAIELSLYQNVLLSALPPLSPVLVTVHAGGTLTPTVFSAATNDHGQIRGTTPYIQALLPTIVKPGDRVVVQAGSYQRDWLLPALTAEVNFTDSLVEGQAPPNQDLTITPFNGSLSVTARSDDAGHYQAYVPSSLTQFGFVVTLHTALGDRLTLGGGSLRWKVMIGSPCLSIQTPLPAMQGNLTLSDAQGRVRATQSLTGFGGYLLQACFSSDGETSAEVRAGDRLRLTTDSGDFVYTVPSVTAVHDPYRGVIVGTTPTAGFITLSMGGSWGSSPLSGRTVSVSATGRYGVDIADVTWMPGQLGFLYFTDASGNSVQQYFTLTGFRQWLTIIGRP